MAKKKCDKLELKVGDRVSYDYHEGTVVSVGCDYCSTIVVEDKDGKRFTPATPGRIIKLS